MPWRPLWRYLGGTAASRSGDEMAGPGLLLLGFAVTGSPATGSALLAGLTVAAAVGGPVFGALLDRSPRPDRVLALTLSAYALGIIAVAATVARLPVPLVVLIALAAGLFTPAVAGGWSSQLPRIVTGPLLSRGHRNLRGVLRRDRHAPGLLPSARRAAAGRIGPRGAADQRDSGRLTGRQLDPGPPSAARPAAFASWSAPW